MRNRQGNKKIKHTVIKAMLGITEDFMGARHPVEIWRLTNILLEKVEV